MTDDNNIACIVSNFSYNFLGIAHDKFIWTLGVVFSKSDRT